jgi:hypothetical protein
MDVFVYIFDKFCLSHVIVSSTNGRDLLFPCSPMSLLWLIYYLPHAKHPINPLEKTDKLMKAK